MLCSLLRTMRKTLLASVALLIALSACETLSPEERAIRKEDREYAKLQLKEAERQCGLAGRVWMAQPNSQRYSCASREDFKRWAEMNGLN